MAGQVQAGCKMSLTGENRHVIGNQLQQARCTKGFTGMIETLIVIVIVILAIALVFKRVLKVFRRKNVCCGCAAGDGCMMGSASKKGPRAVGDATGTTHRGAVM